MTDPNKAKEELSKLTPEELDLELASAMKTYIALLTDIRAKRVEATAGEASRPDSVKSDIDYNKLTIGDAVLTVLKNSKRPMNATQIADALVRAGRKFDSERPSRSVRVNLKELHKTTADLSHINWSKWYLISNCTKSQLERYRKDKANAGMGGRSKGEHSARTAMGIAQRRQDGIPWGRERTAPEVIERAREMFIAGATIREVCQALNVSAPTLYNNGLQPKELKKEGQRQKAEAELAPSDNPEGDNVVRFSKS